MVRKDFAQMAVRIQKRSLDITEHKEWLRILFERSYFKPVFNYQIIVLNSYIKKLQSLAGVPLDDDIFRPLHYKALRRIRKELQETEEIKTAVKQLMASRPDLNNNQLVGFVTFIQKADLLDRETVIDCVRQFKEYILKLEFIKDPTIDYRKWVP